MTTFIASFLPTRLSAHGPRIRCAATAKKSVCHCVKNGAVEARTVDGSNNKFWKQSSIYGFLSFCQKNCGKLPKWLPETDNHHFFVVLNVEVFTLILLTTNPSPKLKFSLNWEVSVNVVLGVGGQLPRNLNWSKSFFIKSHDLINKKARLL